MARKKITLCKSVDELMDTYFPTPTAAEKKKSKLEDEAQEALIKTAGHGKANIHLRARKSTNSLILFLDQTKEGKRVKEILKKLALKIEDNEQIRQNNLTNKAAAEKILEEKKRAILLTGIGIESVKPKAKIKLTSYITSLAESEYARTNNKQSYYYILLSLVRHIELYDGGEISLSQANTDWCKGFINYLKTKAVNGNYLKGSEDDSTDKTKKKDKKKDKPKDVKLSLNYQNQMYRKLNYTFNRAVEENLISINPMSRIPTSEKPKTESDTRNFLTIDEIKILYKTDCQPIQIKQAFLFSCLTGLRFSDLKELKWCNFSKDLNGHTNLNIEMKKLKHLSKNVRTLDVQVSDEALKWLPERGNAERDANVFTLSDNEMCNHQLKRWITAAGITKKITWHCSRHTAATLNLNLGVSVEKVMKLMGHSKLSTTQIYAKILAESLNDEVSKQNGIFD